MAGYVTTHVLDTARGRPAQGMRIMLYRLIRDARTEVSRMHTNADGRTDGPILPPEQFMTGTYQLEFHVADWLSQTGGAGAGAFLDIVPIRFVLDSADHYHVPLLISPYGYSTYRGS